LPGKSLVKEDLAFEFCDGHKQSPPQNYIYLLAKLIFFHPTHVYIYTTSSTYCVGYFPES